MQTDSNGAIIEQTYAAAPATAWKAFSDVTERRYGYFPLEAFEAEIGCRFQLVSVNREGYPYLHLCIVVEVVPQKSEYHLAV